MTESLIGSDGPPAPLVPVGLPIDLSNLVDGQILAYNATTGYWYNRTTLPATAGVDSIGPSGSPLTGAVVVATPNTTLNLSVSGQNLQLDINLGNANTWTALQTFGAGITGTGNMGTLTAGTGVLGTANTWTAAQTLGLAGTSTGLLNLSGTTSGTVGVTVAAAAGTWTLTLPTTAGTANQFLQTNGTGVTSWQTVSASASWSAITAPTADLSLAMGGFTTTFTDSGTWAWDSAAATSTTTTVNSNAVDLLGAFWNGTASVSVGFRTSSTVVSTTVFAWKLQLNNGGTLTQMGYVDNLSLTGFGYQTLAVNTGGNNCAFGYQTLAVNTTGGDNSAFGQAALSENTTGKENTAFGSTSLNDMVTGSYNTAVGSNALHLNTSGNNNCAFGDAALQADSNGSDNCAFGYLALGKYNQTGSASGYLIAVGWEAGFNYTGTELNNIIIGYNLGVAGESNMLRLGNFDSGVAGQGQVAFSQIGLVGLGLPPIYGSAQGVSIAATSTVIATYTPTATGTFRVVVTIECKVAATLDTLTVTYTGSATALAMTQTLATSVALTAGTAVSYVAEAYATTATAVSVQATASVAADLFGTATIERLA